MANGPTSRHRRRAGRGGRLAGALGPLLLLAAAAGCRSGYSQGDCDPGYLDVHGECRLAVGQPCGSGGDCLAGLCVTPLDDPQAQRFCTIACRQHEQCPSGFFCPQGEWRCHPGQRPPPCQDDAECEPCQACEQGTCQAIADCRTCGADADCTGCERCQDGECISVAGCTVCQADADCETCEVCSARGSCTRLSGCERCSQDADCPGCYDCQRGACLPIAGCGEDPCFNDLDCPDRTRCLFDATSALNVCLPVDLAFGQDCQRGGGATCEGGICLTDPGDGSLFCSEPCAQTADCPAGYDCAPDEACLWACRPPSSPPPGEVCESDADCPADRVCGLVAVEDPAGWSTRCLAPLVCAAADGEACGADDPGRCRSGICGPYDLCTPVCAGHADCPPDQLCVRLELPLPEGGLPAGFWGCAPAELARFEQGQPCPRGDAGCRSDFCLAGTARGPHPLCSLGCTPGEAECADGLACLPLAAEPEQDACQPAAASGACSADGDCPQEQVCRLDPISLVPVCAPPQPQGAAVGEACLLDADCAHGLCLPEGRCAAPCAEPADCPEPLWCDLLRLPRPDGAEVWTRLCVPDPGSLLPCRRAADCPQDEVCRLVRNARASGLDGRCGPPGPGAAAGAECDAPAGCAAGLCTTAGRCALPCLAEADCPAGLICGRAQVAAAGRVYDVPACVPEPAGLGQACPGGDADCASGLCLQPAEGPAYCTRTCKTDEDCKAVETMVCLADGDDFHCLFP